ncbi:sugar phosphate nucleotidyltransferase [Cohnella lubricantis]|uniref:Phosphotransferase n=1 Tax=Cohnella lubricantis TaxID=2163172 RepID=A0A841TDI8_9BACL|nr:sugar phosphate nucleotidyltransferase [Cohnella lubricantis]MBB6677398.1 phosphotransferase [Cohnella lubricantis]MBP2118711.1 GTP:adenosylcobinamide-phosphate guanylyltransferase/thiamine kinase-like enzyme [Cohnella lubricantis]
MALEYIIVQAGGKGTRLEHLTTNKPKALVPVENLPMLFHLFRKYPDKRFVIIADYKKDVLREYLEGFANVKYQVVDASGTGTCAGINQALKLIPDSHSFMLVWSDLILPNDFQVPEEDDNYIGISQTFSCRWSYVNESFIEERSVEHGVAGLFIFRDKSYLSGLPESGELVRWMQGQGMRFAELGLAGTKEFGLLSEYMQLGQEKCRPFNRMSYEGDVLIKEGIDDQGKKLARLEKNWYEAAITKGVTNIPKIYGTDPLRMEKVKGANIYEYADLTLGEKREILRKLTSTLKNLHQLERVPVDSFSIKEAYYGKTIDRLSKIRDLIPFSDRRTIMVNGRECRNVFFYKRELERKLDELKCDHYAFIHGDCTFSNLMLRDGKEPILIDPRGYFGYTELYGDPNYDWAKLYYSVVGNYDRFNLKDFRLNIGDDGITLSIRSNQWEELENEFFALSNTDPQTIKLLHAVIWLSLTTYAWQDYDSICGAFYNGLYYLEEVL